jgi:cyclase
MHITNRHIHCHQEECFNMKKIAASVFSVLLACSTVTTFSLLALHAPRTHAQQNFDAVEIKSTKLGDNLFMLVGSGGNMGLLVGNDGTFLIDDQFGPLTPKIEAAIKALTMKPVSIVFNTHWHGDHVGGNVNFARAGATIIAQENVRKRVSTEQFNDMFQRKVPALPPEGWPKQTFTNEMTFHVNGEEIYAFHTPRAHTDGDTILHFKKSNVMHMGDLYFNGFYPFIDYASGGTPDGLIAAIDRAIAAADDKTKIIPGHGPLATKADMIGYRAMLADTIGKIKALAKEGKKLDEIIAAKPTADWDERWGKGFIRPAPYVEMVMKGIGALPWGTAATPAPAAPAPAPKK